MIVKETIVITFHIGFINNKKVRHVFIFILVPLCKKKEQSNKLV